MISKTEKTSSATELAGYTSTSEALPYAISPGKLLMNDFWIIFSNSKYIPGIIWPLWAGRHDPLNELSFTVGNMQDLAFHLILIIVQLGFIISLPLCLVLPTSTSLAYLIGFIALNGLACWSFNGSRDKGFVADPDGVPTAPKSETERWVFINGVAVGEHWLRNNLQLLANTFRRRIQGVHNPTFGIIFDVIQCLIERDFSYNVSDVRQGFAYLKQQLIEDDKTVSKVILILHSQGGIEGGMIVDWLLADMPEHKLAKLEIYTFGNAANHFNNPVRRSLNDFRGDSSLWQQVADRIHSLEGRNYYRAIGHIEHYANMRDFVARFGVLHFTSKDKHPKVDGETTGQGFVTGMCKRLGALSISLAFTGSSSAADDKHRKMNGVNLEKREKEAENRFVGTVFSRHGSGHMFNQHYLANMFTMDGTKVAENNPFMDSLCKVNQDYLNNNPQKRAELTHDGELAVKSMSRLWQYRNGQTPEKDRQLK